MTPGQFTDTSAQLLLLNCGERYRPPLGVAVLPGQPTGTALRNPEAILQNRHGSAAAFRAQKFPSAKSLSIAFSNSASARSLFRRAFFCSNSLRRLASVAYGPRPTTSISRRTAAASGDRSGPTPLGTTDIGEALTLIKQLFSSSQLADDLFGCVSLALHGASPGQVWPLGKLS